MKKLMIVLAMLAAVAVKGELYWAAVYSEAYDKAVGAASTENRELYTAYYCTVDAAKKIFGSSEVAGIESYLKNNFPYGTGIRDEMLKIEGSVELTGGEYGLNQYSFIRYSDVPLESGVSYLAVAFYGEEAFRVFGTESSTLDSGRLRFTDKNATATSVGGWQTVPEPTSGLLLLIGAAGLALRRKREREREIV